MPVPGRKITVQLDPDDPDSTVEISLVEELTTKEGSGPTFRRRITTFNNEQGPDVSSRTIAIREVTHKKRLPEDSDDDPDQKRKCEVIMNAVTAEGSGPMFRRRIYRFNPDDESNYRTRHDKRIKNKDNPDIWVDIRRKDQFITLEGSGPTFVRRLTSVAWDDEKDDNEFDTNTLAAEPVPADPKTPPRLDFLQDIVNVNFGSPLLVLTYEATWSGGLNNSLISLAKFTSPAAPKAIPPVPAHDETDGMFLTGTTRSVDGTTPPTQMPFSKEMYQHLLVWNATEYLLNNHTSGVMRQTIFVNLARLKTKQPIPAPIPPVPISPYTLEFKVLIPGIGEQANDYRFRWNGQIPMPPPLSDVALGDFEVLHLGASQLQAEIDRITIGLANLGAINIVVYEPEQLTFATQTSGSWNLKAQTFGGKKDFPQNPDGSPKWDPTKAISLVEKKESGSGEALLARTITLKVAIPSLKITATMA